jgi:hypothetical protein
MGGGQMPRSGQSQTVGSRDAPASPEKAAATEPERRGELVRPREAQGKKLTGADQGPSDSASGTVGAGQEELIGADEELPESVATLTAAKTTAGVDSAEQPLSVPRGSGAIDQAINAADRLNEGQPKSEKLPASGLQEVAAELQAADAFKDLRSAAEEARAALEEDEREEREGDDAAWRGRLIGPAKQLRDGLVAHLLTNEKLWEQLRVSEIAAAVFDPQSRLVIRKALDLNVEGLLGAMGVKQPQAELLARDLKSALVDLQKEAPNEAMRAARVRNAQQHIAFVTHRLSGAIKDAEPTGTDVDGDRDPDSTSPNPLRTRLRAAMRAGAEAAVPAALAAGAVSLVFPSPDHTAPVVGAAALGVGAKELVKQAVHLAATGLLGRVPTAAEVPATPAERFQGAKIRVDTALSDCAAGLSRLKDSTYPRNKRIAEYLRIESMSAVYGLLQTQLDHAPTGHYAARAVTDSILGSLREAANFMGTLDNRPDDLAAVAQRLETQRQRLQQVLPET